ncbi:MAG: tetratricopeptide repeat protein [Myxococcaceae bacterium]
MTLVLALVLTANPFLAEALEQEQNLDFEKCVQRLKQAATQWKNTPQESRDIELHLGLCRFNLGERDAALEHFRMALRLDPATELPPYTSPKAVEVFLQAKKSLQAPPPPLPDRDLPDGDLPDDRPKRDPPPKLVPTPQPPAGPSPVSAFLARRALPLSLGVVGLASAISGLVLGLRASSLADQARTAHFESDYLALAGSARGYATAANVCWLLAGLSAIGTAITWWVTGEPPPALPSEAPAKTP